MTVAQSGSHRVLLVEDDELQARLYRTMVEQAEPLGTGREPVVVEEAVGTLEETLAILQRSSDRIDLILLDLNLPDSSGLDTLDSILDRLDSDLGTSDRTAVVVLTAIDDASVGREAVERGAQDFLVKDHVTPRSLTQTVAYAIERRDRLAELEAKRRELAVLHWLVRHEIRDDAAVVLGWVRELSTSGPEEERIVSQIVDAGQHIVDLTESVAALVQAVEDSADESSAVDLVDVLDEEIDRLETRFDDADVTFDRPDDPVSVRADRFLNVVVRNVLTNAIVHGGESGQVAVSLLSREDDPVTATDEKEDDSISIPERADQRSSVSDTPTVGFAVSDAGPGLSAADRRLITERTYTDDETGTGVGLYLVRTFVDRYDGRLEIESNQPRGTTVRVWLVSAE